MVQKYQSPIRVYKHPFEMVMAAYEKRFPTCKMIPVFLGSETISEFKDDMQGIHIIERKCKLNVDAPYLLKKIIGVDFVYFIQKNTLNRKERTLKIEAHNETFSARVEVKENCQYTVHPENPDWTCFEQTASLDVKSFFGFENALEKLAIKQYSSNIKKGKEIIEYYLNELISEGVTFIPPFQSPTIETPVVEITNACESTENESKPSTDVSEPCASAIVPSLSAEPLSRDESNFKLESDYIERCLGDLTPFQASCLVQLKKWMAEAHQGKVPSDTTMMRFLQAQDYNLEKAREMLCQSLVWRKKHQLDRILKTYNPPQVVKEFFPGGWHHFDKFGRPLYVLRLGQMDVKGFIKSIGAEGLVKLTLHICEEGLRRTEEVTKASGKPISSWGVLLDLEGLNMRHLWRPGVKALLHIIEIVEANYPETMGQVMIVRAPRVFPILWTIVSTFINDNTRSKFVFYGGNDYLGTGGILEFIDKEKLPDFLGGNCRSTIPDGGLVPKNFYMPMEDYERERADSNHFFDDTMYHSISLAKGQAHEVVISVDDKGSVICWDFDVMKIDVSFSVLHTNKQLPPSTEEQAKEEEVAGCAPSPIPLNMLSLEEKGQYTAIPKTWVLGQDFTCVEAPLTCHDGESVQGSHVTHMGGTYILQWKQYENPNHHTTFDFPLTTHKAKVMYYYEVLKSQDYKGSMSSLQSTYSGNTTNSGQSAMSSTPSR